MNEENNTLIALREGDMLDHPGLHYTHLEIDPMSILVRQYKAGAQRKWRQSVVCSAFSKPIPYWHFDVCRGLSLA